MKIYIIFPGALNSFSGTFTTEKNMSWEQFLKNLLKENYSYLFQENGIPHNYILAYLNSKQLHSLNKLLIYNHDSLNILSAISGG